MAYTHYTNARSASAFDGAQDLIAHLTASLAHWDQARRTRAALSKLSDRELDDIGLTRGDIEMVATQPRL